METRKQPKGHGKPKATTQDVLGGTRARQRIPAQWRRHYRYLAALRQLLLQRQADLAKDALEETPAFSLHMADAGTDSFDRDLALSLLSSEQDALYQIDQAIDRIRNGTYGVCELTGKRIEARRLEAIPWTRFSVTAERQLEQQGARPHARLNGRNTVARHTEAGSK